ncbi:hypothetical protein P0R31_40185 [Bradyrhizobium yuanmingense]|uniref:hypothetical protein n=1 Tax=Bradyrhizobium yuanmingense TaxID=108015 RepID=UPI0023B891F3|nr:hypothetical protein [Bradyrhizobium yuanmingense]MDF0523394.1 hypothetical protein [Bradyrhizobium yuanmingense]
MQEISRHYGHQRYDCATTDYNFHRGVYYRDFHRRRIGDVWDGTAELFTPENARLAKRLHRSSAIMAADTAERSNAATAPAFGCTMPLSGGPTLRMMLC